MSTLLKYVLVVEDEPIGQRVANALLQSLGCKVDVVGSASQALETLKTNDYQLIFMDIGLGDLTGFELTQQIRLSGKKMPIVALTAEQSELVRARCDETGMNDLLIKPLTPTSAKAMLEKFSV